MSLIKKSHIRPFLIRLWNTSWETWGTFKRTAGWFYFENFRLNILEIFCYMTCARWLFWQHPGLLFSTTIEIIAYWLWASAVVECCLSEVTFDDMLLLLKRCVKNKDLVSLQGWVIRINYVNKNSMAIPERKSISCFVCKR